jgi:hypothetical protein
VFEWELDRKKQVKMLKKICYYPPSMIKRRHKSKKRRAVGDMDPNTEVYQFYQQNLINGGLNSSSEQQMIDD